MDKVACLGQVQAPFVAVEDMVFDLDIGEGHSEEAAVRHSYHSCMDGQVQCRLTGHMEVLDAVEAAVA